eukprot:Awhi_evm1s5260
MQDQKIHTLKLWLVDLSKPEKKSLFIMEELNNEAVGYLQDIDAWTSLTKAQRQCIAKIEATLDSLSEPTASATRAKPKSLTRSSENLEICLELLAVAASNGLVDHLVVTRIHKSVVLYGTACLELSKKRSRRNRSAMFALKSSLKVQKQQGRYLSVDHYDVGSTAKDIELLLSFLLSNDPQTLFQELKDDDLDNFSKASKKEFENKKLFRKINDLYKDII